MIDAPFAIQASRCLRDSMRPGGRRHAFTSPGGASLNYTTTTTTSRSHSCPPCSLCVDPFPLLLTRPTAMAEQRAQLLTYSAAATAACVSVSALCLAYSSLASGGPSKTHSSSDAHQQRAITINNYAASKDHTDENADEDGSSSSSSGPEAASSGSSSDKTSSDSTDKDKKDEKSEPRYKRVLQYWDQNECELAQSGTPCPLHSACSRH